MNSGFLVIVALVVTSVAACWTGALPPPTAPLSDLKVEREPTCPRFGELHNPSGPRSAFHLGVDFNTCQDEHVISVADGKVTSTSVAGDGTKGAMIVVHHPRPDGTRIGVIYAHLRESSLREGDTVKRGQVLGPVWIPKESEYPNWTAHVHINILGAGVPVEDLDPLRFLKGCISEVLPEQWVFPVKC